MRYFRPEGVNESHTTQDVDIGWFQNTFGSRFTMYVLIQFWILYILVIVAKQINKIYKLSVKVHIFREGHKNFAKSPP